MVRPALRILLGLLLSSLARCLRRIQRTLGAERGIETVDGDGRSKQPRVRYRPGRTSGDRIRKRLADAGFPAG